MTPREKVLLLGLVDWVALERIHASVATADRRAPVSVIQTRTLELIRSLANDGLIEIGDLTGEDACFAPWDRAVDVSIDRIRTAYVTHFDDANVWPWHCWISLTSKGEAVARTIEARSQAQP